MIGAGAAALLGWALHGPLGQGEAFLADLHLRSITALAGQGLGDVQVRYPAAPHRRNARLSGPASPAQRFEALAIVSGVEGNSGAVWHGAAEGEADRADGRAVALAASAASQPAPTAPPSTDTMARSSLAQDAPSSAVLPAPLSAATCQQDVDAAAAGQAVQFRDGSAWLSPPARRTIARVAAAFRDCRGLVLAVGGHGNGTGPANRAMADERARRVRAALIEAGVPADAVTARGYGAARPLHVGRPADAANRRVSFTIMAGGG